MKPANPAAAQRLLYGSILKALNLTASTVQAWECRGGLRVGDKVGAGRQVRRFYARDLAALMLMQQLSENGIAPSRAAQFTNEAAPRLSRLISLAPNWTGEVAALEYGWGPVTLRVHLQPLAARALAMVESLTDAWHAA